MSEHEEEREFDSRHFASAARGPEEHETRRGQAGDGEWSEERMTYG
jgi:hypothetical protein